MKKFIAVVAPHPDDETFGCGGTILKKISEGYEILLITVTAGRNALSVIFGIQSNPTPEELKEIRLKENLNVIKTLGISPENWYFLDYEDGKVEYHKDEIKKEISDLFNKFQPAEVYSPFHKDVNSDHKATSEIVQSCLERLAFSPSVYQYSIAQKFSRLSPACTKLFNPILHQAIFVDISNFVQQKKAALTKYESQLSIISDKQNRPVMTDISPFLKPKEMFYL